KRMRSAAPTKSAPPRAALRGATVRPGAVRGHARSRLRRRAPRRPALRGTGIFSQADTTRCAYEERRADTRLKGAYCLADRRWSPPEFRGCPAKTAVLSNTEEGLHAVERTLPDCEVLLHGSSTLSPIGDRGKQPHI